MICKLYQCTKCASHSTHRERKKLETDSDYLMSFRWHVTAIVALVTVHTEQFSWKLVKSNRNQILFNIFQDSENISLCVRLVLRESFSKWHFSNCIISNSSDVSNIELFTSADADILNKKKFFSFFSNNLISISSSFFNYLIIFYDHFNLSERSHFLLFRCG